MVSSCPLISKSSSTFTKPLGIVPSAPVTTDITVTFMFRTFLILLQGLGIHISFYFGLILFCGLPGWQSIITIFCYFTFCKFFIPVLTGSISLKTEWQQVSSGLQHSSECSGWCQQCWRLEGPKYLYHYSKPCGYLKSDLDADPNLKVILTLTLTSWYEMGSLIFLRFHLIMDCRILK